MAYTHTNFKSKKEIKEAIAAGKTITCFQPGPFGPDVPANGTIHLEGPHYPQPHRWYGTGTMRDGKLIAIK